MLKNKISFICMALLFTIISYSDINLASKDYLTTIFYNNVYDGKRVYVIGGFKDGEKDATNLVYATDSYIIGNSNIVGTPENLSKNIFILGSNIKAINLSDAIVLGNNSQAVEHALSIGSVGNERKIVNVADGEISKFSKESINGSQLYNLSQTLNLHSNKIMAATSGVANSIAVASLPQVASDKLFSFSAGAGYYEKNFAVAIGFSGQTKQRNFTYKVNVSLNNNVKVGVGLGVDYSFGDIY